ncbi:uncharacterized protein LOC134192074 isoform X2 [Corticium candelabrum]|nr:uncharacterized protein LOC134192074 isoform X2 [Corticium candelabrum]
MKAIYLLNTKNVKVVCRSASEASYSLDLPAGSDPSQQFVSCWAGDKFTVDAVVREGVGYPTTAAKKEEADRRAECMKERLSNLVEESIKVGPATAAGSAKAKSDATPEFSGASHSPPEAPVNIPESFVTADALLDVKSQLKPTQTIEHQLPVVGVPHCNHNSGSQPAPTGASTAIKEEEDKREFFENPEDLEKKLELLAKWIQCSKHVIFFTGAGISTSTGIPDFRSGMNTVLETGPGVWELRANLAARPATAKTVNMLKAIPSAAHMAIVEMHKKELVKATVSQNVDGLHRRSGISAEEIAELHGNMNLETCEKCNRQYLRDFETRTAFGVFNHVTGRQCDDPDCNGRLMDSIINFRENVPENELRKAFSHAIKADLCIVLGSSLRVTPAALVPKEVAKQGKLVICNLQQTPLDDCASLVIHAKCDDVMVGIAKKLQFEIPPFKVPRRLQFTSKPSQEHGRYVVSINGLDESSDIPYSFIQEIEVAIFSKKNAVLKTHLKVKSEPIELEFKAVQGAACNATIRVHFHGHYGEIPLELDNNFVCGQSQKTVWKMAYNPLTGIWETDVLHNTD